MVSNDEVDIIGDFFCEDKDCENILYNTLSCVSQKKERNWNNMRIFLGGQLKCVLTRYINLTYVFFKLLKYRWCLSNQ